MARYRILAPVYVEGLYHFAAPTFPVELELGDEVAPSRKWEPLDAGAVKALEKLGVKKHASHKPTPQINAAHATPAPARPPRASDKETL
jgi:hypothetical protein